MNDFTLYFQTGWEHIISLDALDHQLFICMLSIMFIFSEWKKLLVLVTAFTVGHSITLALSSLAVIKVNQTLVEILIPATIIFSALVNLFLKNKTKSNLLYLLVVGFGLIHGLGFANTIRFMLADEQSIFIPLMAFNLGLEVGQLLVVVIILAASHLLLYKIPRRYLTNIVSFSVLVLGTCMFVNRLPLVSMAPNFISLIP